MTSLKAGILCPACGAPKQAVINSRLRDGRVWRRRECACGFRFSTEEVIVGSTKDADELRGRLQKLHELHSKSLSILTTGKLKTGRSKIAWTAEMDACLRNAARQGLSLKSTGELIGVDASVVSRRKAQLGIAPNKPWAEKRATGDKA